MVMKIKNNVVRRIVVIIAASLPITACFSEDTASQASSETTTQESKKEASKASTESTPQVTAKSKPEALAKDSSSGPKYINVTSATDDECDIGSKYFCVASRKDETLGEMASSVRDLSVTDMCNWNNIPRAECDPKGIIKKRTWLKALRNSK